MTTPFRIPEDARTASPIIQADAPRVRMPNWYRAWCRSMSKAVWLGQVTEREATVALDALHRAALVEALR